MQDEIARKIAEALRITLTPQEQQALAAKPTENLQAYDLYLRGKSYARRLTRQDLEFALQMFENAVALDPELRARLRRDRQRLRAVPLPLRARRRPGWIARMAASETAVALQPGPAGGAGRPGVDPLRRAAHTTRRCASARQAIGASATARAPTTCSAARCSPRADTRKSRTSPTRRSRRAATDYNVYVPIMNALGALGKTEALRNIRLRRIQALEAHLRKVPEDARARIHAGHRLRRRGPHRGSRARSQLRDRAAAERRERALQRRLRLLRDGTARPRPSTRCSRPGTPASATPTGRAAIPTSPSCTAIRSSSGCIPSRSSRTPHDRQPAPASAPGQCLGALRARRRPNTTGSPATYPRGTREHRHELEERARRAPLGPWRSGYWMPGFRPADVQVLGAEPNEHNLVARLRSAGTARPILPCLAVEPLGFEPVYCKPFQSPPPFLRRHERPPAR